ncbi:Pre-rRNA-processing protein TSR1-like protein [Armadillidium vulgare]|nr:Pre-rRNA-processing protein TSR1-like protein [Armadillidium vulgare]
MALSGTIQHKAKLKQQNKKHNAIGHKSKRQVLQSNKGRVSSLDNILSLKSNVSASDLKSLSRDQRRNQTKQIRAHKREEVIYAKRQIGTESTPPFMVSVVPLSFDIDANQILHYLTDLDQSSIVNYSDSGIAHISCKRLKQRFAFGIPQIGDLYANLDLAKGSDTILFVWKLGEELKSIFETIISSLFSQGFHSVLHAVVADEDFSTKKKVRLLKELQSHIASRFTGHFRLFFLNKIQEINLLYSKIGSQKRKSVFYKDERAHIVAEKVMFEGEGSTGTLKLQGYIRSQPLSVNSLVHIPGWGEFQLSQMDLVLDPFPLDSKKRNNKFQLSEYELLDKPNPELQESLESTCEGDLPDEDSMSQISIGETEGFETVEETRIIKKRGPKGFSSYQSAWLLDDKNDAREDAEFPDEMETPNDIPAKVRFQKYHGLESFKKSPWTDPYLPLEYEKIFNTKNFSHLKFRILKRGREGALPGWYVMLHISDVPRHMYMEYVKTKAPLVVFSLLPFEQKISVVHAVVKSHSLGHIHPIKSKERLVFHVGFRRYTNCPIFSECGMGDKHKFLRFFQPGQTVVATMYAPVTFPSCPLTVFRMRPNGEQISTRHSIIRYMFFNREDILFFKSIKLRTKLGRKGNIVEPVGTHGHMKCSFDRQLQSQDTVLMNLYKRVFPKWRYDPFVPRSLTPLEKKQRAIEYREMEKQADTQSEEKSKKKKVKFSDE